MKTKPEQVNLKGRFDVICRGPDGKVKWTDYAENLVVYEGLNHILDVLFISTTGQIDPWYVGLCGASPAPANADTLASHAGWTEFASYTGDRKEYVDARSNQQVTNSASKASFSINQDSSTIGGAFLASAATGTSGALLCCAAFTGGNKSADNGDTLEVTYTFSAASS